MMYVSALFGKGANMSRIAELAVRLHLPAMFIARQWVEAGGLMSYGVNFTTMYRRAAA